MPAVPTLAALLIAFTGFAAGVLAAAWLCRRGPSQHRTQDEALVPEPMRGPPIGLGLGLGLTLPILAMAGTMQWRASAGGELVSNIAMLMGVGLPIGAAMLGWALLLVRTPPIVIGPRLAPAGIPELIGVGMVVLAWTGSATLIDAQIFGLLGIAWWWRSARGAGRTRLDGSSSQRPAIRRDRVAGPVSLAVVGGTLAAAGSVWLAVLVAILWIMATAWWTGRFATRWSGDRTPALLLGLAAGGSAIGLGWLGLLESIRVVAEAIAELRAVGIGVGFWGGVGVAAEALGARPRLWATGLLAAPGAALIALAIVLRAGWGPTGPGWATTGSRMLLGCIWMAAAAALVAIPLGMVLAGI